MLVAQNVFASRFSLSVYTFTAMQVLEVQFKVWRCLAAEAVAVTDWFLGMLSLHLRR